MKQLLLLLALLLAGCTPRAAGVVPTDPVEKEEYAVYSALINSRFSQNPFDTLSIDSQTTRGCHPFEKIEGQAESLKEIGLIFQGVERSTIARYEDKNKVKHPLTDSFSLVARHVFDSSEHDATQVMLSAVGLNDASDQALVCAGIFATSSSGLGFTIGHYFLLQKENGVWVVKDQRQVWIS